MNSIFSKMTPGQRRRAIEIARAWRELKADVLNPSHVEPRLASPRSSLHPQIVQGENE
jgi:hypothetical protein